jgi:hypothetical protein
MVAMFAMYTQLSHYFGATFLHFNLISGMPFNPKIKAFPILSQT